MPRLESPLWHCPRCGHPFVNRNQQHSCGTYELDAHFVGCEPVVRSCFDRFRELIERNGPVIVEPQKTRIVFVVRVRFAGAVPRRRHLNAGMWLRRRIEHPRLVKIESYGRMGFGHHLRFDHPGQLDEPLAELLREAYAIGIGAG